MTERTITCRQSGTSYPYTVHQGLTPQLILTLHKQWEDEKNRILQQIIRDVPQALQDNDLFVQQLYKYGLADFGWRWLDKAIALNSDDYHWFFLEADDKFQAVCIIYHPKSSREDNEKIFYIDYIASAYWNRDRPSYSKQFGKVGRILIAHATHFAINNLGYRPGFCLHSLPTAESYYRGIGMTQYEPDTNKENLRYFEAPAPVAQGLAEEAVHG